MKKKLKLAFDELEKEMSVLSFTEQSIIIGGTGNSIDYYVDYYVKERGYLIKLSSDGSTYTLVNPMSAPSYFSENDEYYMWDEDSQGLARGKWIGNVTVSSSFSNQEDAQTSIRSTIVPYTTQTSTSQGSGYIGPTPMDQYNEMIARAKMLYEFKKRNPSLMYDPSTYQHVTPHTNPNDPYNNNTNPDNQDPYNNDPYTYDPYANNPYVQGPGPWERTGDGKLVTTATGNVRTDYEFGDYKFDFKEVKIKTAFNTEVIAYEVTAVYDTQGNLLYTGDDIPQDLRSNCHGLAFAGGDVWIADLGERELNENGYYVPSNTQTNELASFENMLTSGFHPPYSKLDSPSSAILGTVAVAWSSYQGIQHSGTLVGVRMNSDGSSTNIYQWKNTEGQTETGTFEKCFEKIQSGIPINFYHPN